MIKIEGMNLFIQPNSIVSDIFTVVGEVHNIGDTSLTFVRPVDVSELNNYSWGRYDTENNYNGKVGYVKDVLLDRELAKLNVLIYP